MDKYTKIYNKGIEYTKGPNFLNGTRVCPNCTSNMERIPTNQSFVRVPNGKILVNLNTISGKMSLSNIEPSWYWGCTDCVLGIAKEY